MKFGLALVVSGLALVGLGGWVAARPAAAAPAEVTLTVNSPLDKVDNHPGDGACLTASHTCTLRAAIMEANLTTSADTTILLPAGVYSFTLAPVDADGPESGDLGLTAPASGNPVIRLVGAGAASTIIDANHLDRVLTIDRGRTASLSDLTLRNGYLTGSRAGGAIENEGSLTLLRTIIRGNHSEDLGGAVYNFQSLAVSDSTLASNEGDKGGALFNGGLLTVERSTLNDNLARYGGGILNDGGDHVALINSTLSGNNTTLDGGGLYNFGVVDIYNSSILSNDADSHGEGGSAGGIYNHTSGTVNLRNTLLAGNYVDNTPIYDDCTGTLHTYGRDLFGEAAPCTLVVGDGSIDVLNSLALLGPLQDNGGPTHTQALLAGSNAIDGGDPGNGCLGPTSALATDQRGFPRVVGAHCDIGAFEFLPPVAFLPIARR